MNGGGASTSYTDITSSGTLSGLTFSTASTLTTGQTYLFKVIATNAVGDSTASPQSTDLMAAVLPSAPASISKFSADASSITVAWTAPTDTGGTSITNYIIYCNGGGGSSTFTEVATVSGATLQHTHSSLSPPGETFSYKVSAVNYIGEGP
jgi:fibronectin type 3 domain-containing protein